jgi:hypothetical protein
MKTGYDRVMKTGYIYIYIYSGHGTIYYMEELEFYIKTRWMYGWMVSFETIASITTS